VIDQSSYLRHGHSDYDFLIFAQIRVRPSLAIRAEQGCGRTGAEARGVTNAGLCSPGC
jgi:hypothetical protein